MHLFLDWVEAPNDNRNRTPLDGVDRVRPAWFGAAQKYARQVSKHDMESVRRSIVSGRAGSAALSTPGKRQK
jgi:hypothetical protein